MGAAFKELRCSGRRRRVGASAAAEEGESDADDQTVVFEEDGHVSEPGRRVLKTVPGRRRTGAEEEDLEVICGRVDESMVDTPHSITQRTMQALYAALNDSKFLSKHESYSRLVDGICEFVKTAYIGEAPQDLRRAKTQAADVRTLCTTLLTGYYDGDFRTMTSMLSMPAAKRLKAVLCAAHVIVMKCENDPAPGPAPGGGSAPGLAGPSAVHDLKVAGYGAVQRAKHLRATITTAVVPAGHVAPIGPVA